MIDDLDEVLRQFLIRDLPIKNGEVDIKFDQPKREWSARVSRPTLNLFLYDIRENQKLRQTQPAWELTQNGDGTVTKRRKPARVDLHYMITAWAAEPEDEHRLLSRSLMVLFRYPALPEELLPEILQSQPVPIPLMVAQYDELRTPSDVWNVLDNEMRPALACIVTLAIDPYLPIVTPLVRTRELRIGPSRVPSLHESEIDLRLDARTGADLFWTIGGTLHSEQPLDLEKAHLVLVERGLEVPLQPEGRFVIGHLVAGEYTLEISVAGRPPRRYSIAVPAADYDLEV
jgi:Pvc16 N-terminal domain